MNIVRYWRDGILVTIAFYLVPLHAEEIRTFATTEQQQRYQKMIEELRCLVCQNQNLADSDAGLAQDLRNEIYTMITAENKSEDEIIDFMVARYGDFVLYEPPLKPTTVLLWFGPFVLISLSVLILVIYLLRRSEKQSQTGSLSTQDRSRLKQLLQKRKLEP